MDMCFIDFRSISIAAVAIDTTEVNCVGIVHVRNSLMTSNAVLVFSVRRSSGFAEKLEPCFRWSEWMRFGNSAADVAP